MGKKIAESESHWRAKNAAYSVASTPIKHRRTNQELTISPGFSGFLLSTWEEGRKRRADKRGNMEGQRGL